ncbi:hypothetical protein AQZ49_20670 [Novosphingobium sp. FSW06-99]|nr:hypothetical protein AQZ49_20670 [Novosphingobium sp. FSW06-99]
MNYRFGGKQRTIAFGNYPDLSLAKARERRTQAREALADGKDPIETKRLQEREIKSRSEDTFQAISREWLEKLECEGRSASTMSKLRWLVDFAIPHIGERPITDLTARDLLDILRTVEVRGRYETANRLRSTFGTIFRYAIATARAQRDISADLKGALITPKTKHHAAILDPKMLGALLRAVENYEGQPTQAVGPERMQRLWPVQEVVTTGANVVVGSDWPVIADVNPWLALETLVTRQAPGATGPAAAPNEAITRAEALRLLTVNGAREMGRLDRGGTIEPGKLADVIVVDRNPLTAPIGQIHATRVLATYIAGEQVFALKDAKP